MASGGIDRSPVRAGVLLSLGTGALAVAAVADARGQLVAIGLELLAVLVLAVGTSRRRSGQRVVGTVLAVGGGLGVPAAIGYGVVSSTQAIQVIELVPGMVGLGLLALGGLPVRRRWSRALVGAGAITVGIAILASGVVNGADRLGLLAGTALAVIAWDAAEQAVNLGEQVGRDGASPAVVATHGAWSVGVGAVGIGAASGVYAVDVTGLPLLGVGLLLVAAVAVATAAFT